MERVGKGKKKTEGEKGNTREKIKRQAFLPSPLRTKSLKVLTGEGERNNGRWKKRRARGVTTRGGRDGGRRAKRNRDVTEVARRRDRRDNERVKGKKNVGGIARWKQIIGWMKRDELF